VVLLPKAEHTEKWVIPLSVQRVKGNEKGHEKAVQQVKGCIENLALAEKFHVMIGDTLYGSLTCRDQASREDNLIHVFRLRNQRNVYLMPEAQASEETAAKRGRKRNLVGVSPWKSWLNSRVLLR
jgi:hypothetical protein